jgi:MscS family membrane protein
MNLIVTGLLSKVFIVIIVTLLLDQITRRVLNRLVESKNTGMWLSLFCDVFLKFMPWIIWGTGVLVVAEVFSDETEFLFNPNVISTARDLFLIGALTWAFVYFKNIAEKKLLVEHDVDPNSRALINVGSRIATIVIVTFAGIMAMDVLGMPLSALLAFGGLGGVAISLSATDVIKNFFGGLMIYINRPFLIGDWIKSPNKNFEGVVENIGWYMTQIRTFERRPTYIPNSLITDAIIENPGRMYNRRIKTIIGVRYADIDSVDSIAKSIEKMLREHPGMDQKQILMVHFLEFGPCSLDIEIYAFTKTTNWAKYREVQQDVLLKVGKIVSDHNAEMAFPTSTIHLDNSQNASTPAKFAVPR